MFPTHKIFIQGGLLNNIYDNLISTLISLIVIAFIYVIFYFLVIRKIENVRQKQKTRIRSFYVACVIFIFLMAHVWVDGFTHLLTILGLVSAGLVVTNKEIIMNFVGWLVITWRGLFAEEDLIQVQQYKGYVKRIGVFYFTLFEVSDLGNGVTGRVIRVPNGLTATNPIINYSQTSHLQEQRVTFLVSRDNDFESLKQSVKALVEKVLIDFYQGQQEQMPKYLSNQNKQLQSRIRAGAKITLRPKLDSLISLELIVRYFCFSQDIEKVQESILLSLLDLIKKDPAIKLV